METGGNWSPTPSEGEEEEDSPRKQNNGKEKIRDTIDMEDTEDEDGLVDTPTGK